VHGGEPAFRQSMVHPWKRVVRVCLIWLTGSHR
jgi:hypothetical protein